MSEHCLKKAFEAEVIYPKMNECPARRGGYFKEKFPFETTFNLKGGMLVFRWAIVTLIQDAIYGDVLYKVVEPSPKSEPRHSFGIQVQYGGYS